MPDYPSTSHDYVVASYRYLRLAMVILVVTLAISIVIEITRASCWQGSISAYYYTPVHAVFVGALIAIGVSLVALKGRDTVEDLFFNLAGILAPLVALVPTSRPSKICSDPGEELTITTTALVSNNVPALLGGALAAIVVAYAIARRQGKVQLERPPTATIVGLGIGVVLLIGGFWWYNAEPEHFEKYAHGTAAVAMFVAIWLAVLVNAGWPAKVLEPLYRLLGEDRPPRNTTARDRQYRQAYRLVAGFMVLAAVLIVATGLLGVDWDQRIFWLEAFEIAPFAVFWTLQTLEAWTSGVPDLPATT